MIVLKQSTCFMFIYLCMTFVVAVRLDGVVVRLPSTLLVIPLFFTTKIIFPRRAGFIFIVFIAFTLAHYLIIEATGIGMFSFKYVLKDYILYVGVFGIYLFLVHPLNWSDTNNFAHKFFKVIVVISLGLYLLSMLGGIDIGIDNSHTPVRVSGVMTEPANLAHFLPAFVVYSFCRRHWIWLCASFTLLILTFSPTVLGTLTGTILLFYLIKYPKIRVVFLVLFLIFVIYLFFADYASYRNYLSDKGLVGFVGIRIVDGIQYIVTGGELGYNSRALLYFDGIDIIKKHGLLYTGAGFASSIVLADLYNGGMLYDSTTFFSIFIWFGMLPLFAYFFIQWKLIKYYSSDFLSMLLLSLCVSNFITGGGVWIQMFFWSLLWMKYRSMKQEIVV